MCAILVSYVVMVFETDKTKKVKNKQETDYKHQSPVSFNIMLQRLFLSNFIFLLHHFYTTMALSFVELCRDM